MHLLLVLFLVLGRAVTSDTSPFPLLSPLWLMLLNVAF